ncbi:MAG: hypothetical protein ACYS76_03810 [Planctomycetota bacterium]|jgi:hypothetical protein
MNKDSRSLQKRRGLLVGLICALILVLIWSYATIVKKPYDLLTTYRAYGLPLPPDDARLVIYDKGLSYARLDGKEHTYKYLAFLLEQGSSSEPDLLLVGPFVHRIERGRGKVTFVGPNRRAARDIRAQWYEPVFELNTGLFTAIQCKARGWNSLADALLKRSLKSDYGHRFSGFYQPADLPPKAALAMAAWAYWGNQLIEPDSDRKLIAARMKSLLQTEPRLDKDYNRALLASLEAALLPSEAEPNTVEAMIDDLVEMCWKSNGLSGHHELDKRYLRLGELGFEAAPKLIQHLDDKRLTRSVLIGFNNFAPYHRTVGDIVSDLLQHISGKELGKNWLLRLKGWNVEKKTALSWWKKARKIGEERYVLENVLPSEPNEQWPNEIMLRIITRRYTSDLPARYTTLLDDRRSLQSWPIAQAITRSSLDPEQKINLFVYAANNRNLEHRRAAFWELKKLDSKRFEELLVQTLDDLPPTPTEAYGLCREASFANLVMETDSEKVWATFLRAAKRSDVGLRMEFLSAMNYCYVGDRHRRQRLVFLRSFLDDTSVRHVSSRPEMFEGPYAASDFRCLEVRNLAAQQIAVMLKMPSLPKPDWSTQHWAAFRAEIRAALEKQSKTGLDRL